MFGQCKKRGDRKWTVGVAAQESRGSGLLEWQHRREGKVDCWSGGTGEKGKWTVGVVAQERRESGLLEWQHRKEGKVDCWSGGTGKNG
jgi:hypothetical protein